MTAISMKTAAHRAAVPIYVVRQLVAEGKIFSDRGRVSEAVVPLLIEQKAALLHRVQAREARP